MAKRIRKEADMEEAVAIHLGRAVRQIRVGGCRFDIVAYDKRVRQFTLVECKKNSKATAVGQAFGQVAAYYALLSGRGFDFMDTVNRPLRLRYGTLMEATHGDRFIDVAFHVALTDKACRRQAHVIKGLKELVPAVGIIRVKEDGRCRSYLRNGEEKDYRTARARPMKIKLRRRSPLTEPK